MQQINILDLLRFTATMVTCEEEHVCYFAQCELFRNGHLILLCSVAPAGAVLAVVALAVPPELFTQISLMLGGTLGVFLGEQLGANTVSSSLPSSLASFSYERWLLSSYACTIATFTA